MKIVRAVMLTLGLAFATGYAILLGGCEPKDDLPTPTTTEMYTVIPPEE